VRYRAFVSDSEFRASERTITLEIQVTFIGIGISVITDHKATVYFSATMLYSSIGSCFRIQMVLQCMVFPEPNQ